MRIKATQLNPICFMLYMMSLCFIIHQTPVSHAIEMDMPSTPNPVGSGARALGMGGAFIAVADDATAASWNPAGLIQLDEPEISMVFDGFYRKEKYLLHDHPESSGIGTVTDDIGFNFASISLPLFFLLPDHLKKPAYYMVVSATYQKRYDFTREKDYRYIDGNIDNEKTYRQDGSLSVFGLSYCFRIPPYISLGVTFNFWNDWLNRNRWDQKNIINTRIDQGTGSVFTRQTEILDRFSFKGFNMNIGFMWSNGKYYSIGAVVKTPFTADLSREHIEIYEETSSDGVVFVKNDSFESRNERLDMPWSYGIGMKWYLKEKGMTWSLDVYKTEWDDFVYSNPEGEEFSPISGNPVAESDVDSIYQVRTGFEWRFHRGETGEIALTTGAFYDPAPAEVKPDRIYGFCLGLGYSTDKVSPDIRHPGFAVDLAYQYRFGNDIGAFKEMSEDTSSTLDLREHTVYASLIMYF